MGDQPSAPLSSATDETWQATAREAFGARGSSSLAALRYHIVRSHLRDTLRARLNQAFVGDKFVLKKATSSSGNHNEESLSSLVGLRRWKNF